MTSSGRRRTRRKGGFARALRVILAVVLALSCLLGIYYLELTSTQRDYFLQRRGSLADVHPQPHEIAGNGRVLQDVTLASSSGLTVAMRLLRPAVSDGRRLPTLLLINGWRTGKHAVDLLDRPGDVAFAAIEYPYDGPMRSTGVWQTTIAIRAIQRTTVDTPPALLLAVDWLVAQPWVDPQRIELAGVSLGVPFAAAAAAIDERISRVWLVHGSADNQSWAELNLRSKVSHDSSRRLVARLALLFIYAESFDTLAWMRHTAPRPIVVVSARHDERVPRGQALADRADAEIAEIIWTEGPHIRASREAQLQELFDLFLTHMNTRPTN